jgi:hypothetical protein
MTPIEKRAAVLAALGIAIIEAELVDGLFAITAAELTARAEAYDKSRKGYRKPSKTQRASFAAGWRRCEAGNERVYDDHGYDACAEYRRSRSGGRKVPVQAGRCHLEIIYDGPLLRAARKKIAAWPKRYFR